MSLIVFYLDKLIMRRALFFVLALLLAVNTFAQSRIMILNESFDSETMPEGWSITGSGTTNWHMSQTNKAGGVANEIYFGWSPSFENGTSRLTSPSVDLTNVSSVVVSFKHYLDYFSNSSILGVATSSDGGNTWNEGWSQSYDTDGQYNINQIISTSDMGKSDVLFCIYFQGSSNFIDYWYFDDISVSTIENLDANLTSIDVPSNIFSDEIEISFTLQNIGMTRIDSFEASYEIDGNIVTETFSTNMNQFESEQFTFSEEVALIPDGYLLSVEITSVNGENDGYSANNILEKDINIAMGTTGRTPMIEHFSSSTCGPCVYVNSLMHQLCVDNPGKFAYVKYPTNFPNPGDPYNTEDANIRDEYYNINAAPQLVYNGVNVGSAVITTEQLNNSYNSETYVNIEGAFNVEGNAINVVVDVMSYIELKDAKVYVAVNEKTTTGNVGSNGEYEFHHIMMKMLDNANGNDYSVKAGEYQRFQFTYDMSQTHVEEMSDLEVAVWVQNYETKEIYNSHFLNEYTVHNYPVMNLQMVENGNKFDITWSAPQAGEPSGYKVLVNNEVVAESTQNHSYSFERTEEYYVVEVVALYDETTSIGIITNNFPQDEDPCMAPENLNATVEQDVTDYEHNFKVTLIWDAVDGAKEYVVYIEDEIPVNTTENTYVVGYDAEGEHEFKVATICENGMSEQSETYTFVVTGTSIDEHQNAFMIYPNPAKDLVKISAISGQSSLVRIYNVMGMTVEEIEMNSDNIEINISDYERGIYFFNIDGNVVKVVKN